MNIQTTNNSNYEALAYNTKTAREMALTSHSLSQNGNYARLTGDNSLWIWSDRRNAWVQIDRA